MTERPYFCREWLIEDARAAVLAGMDKFAAECGLHSPPGTPLSGWQDKDLPELFRGIDAHVDRLIERAGVLMPDQPYDPAYVAQSKAALAEALGRVK